MNQLSNDLKQLLKGFQCTDGQYSTLQLINFLNNFVFIEKEDVFYQDQIFENLKGSSFGDHYRAEDLLRFYNGSQYIHPLGKVTKEERHHLQEIFDSHLKSSSHIIVAEGQRENEFNVFLQKLEKERNQIDKSINSKGRDKQL